mgnify:CR=1 FL=1
MSAATLRDVPKRWNFMPSTMPSSEVFTTSRLPRFNSFVNVLKKFNVTVTKTDVETGTPQGDASLAGAVYGIYKGVSASDKM